MLGRTETVERLITLRKQIFCETDHFPAKNNDAAELDQLLIDIIGPPQDKEERIFEIINLAIFESITPRTAAVAIKELVTQKQKQKQVKKQTGAENIEILEERGWNT